MNINLSHRIKLKYFLPLLIFGFAITNVVISYINAKSVLFENLKEYRTKEMINDLIELQGIIQLLLRNGNIDGVKSFISTFGAEYELKSLFFTDADGTIRSSTRVDTIGKRWTELEEPIDPQRIKSVGNNRSYEVYAAPDRENLYGYIDICVAAESGELRPSGCGFLFYWKNVKARNQLALAAFRTQGFQHAAGAGLLALLLWWLLHVVITRRVGKISEIASRFSNGEWAARNRLTGKDELADIGEHLDNMFDAVTMEHNELLHSKAQINAIIETAVDGIITITESGIVQSANSAIERLFGYPRDQVIGHNIKMLMPESYANEHNGYIKNYLATGEKKIIGIGREVEGLRKDGTVFPMDLAVSELIDGNDHSFIGLIRDISQRKNAEKQLKIHEEQLRLTFENAPTGIVTCDLDCRFLSANTAYKRMAEYTDSELMRTKLTDTIHPDDRNLCFDFTNQAKIGKLKENRISLRWLTKTGEILRGTLHIGLIHDEKGSAKSFVVQLENQTKQMSAENEVRLLRDRLAHVGRVSTMGEMAAGIAHEINQPLTAIASYAEACQRLLQSGNIDVTELTEAMERTGEQAHRAGQVIRRMRSFVKERASTREELDINELIKEVVELAKMDLPIQNSSIRLKLTENLPKIVADSFQIQQVILNLIRNGAEAMQNCAAQDRTLEIHTHRLTPNHIRISVRDRGHGISDEHAQKIFSPFFTTKEKGMGIGLAICRTVVESHHGELSFENNPAGGTTFNLTLPIEPKG